MNHADRNATCSHLIAEWPHDTTTKCADQVEQNQNHTFPTSVAPLTDHTRVEVWWKSGKSRRHEVQHASREERFGVKPGQRVPS